MARAGSFRIADGPGWFDLQTAFQTTLSVWKSDGLSGPPFPQSRAIPVMFTIHTDMDGDRRYDPKDTPLRVVVTSLGVGEKHSELLVGGVIAEYADLGWRDFQEGLVLRITYSPRSLRGRKGVLEAPVGIPLKFCGPEPRPTSSLLVGV